MSTRTAATALGHFGRALGTSVTAVLMLAPVASSVAVARPPGLASTVARHVALPTTAACAQAWNSSASAKLKRAVAGPRAWASHVQALASDVTTWTWGNGHTQTLRGPACIVSVIARPRKVVVSFGAWRKGT